MLDKERQQVFKKLKVFYPSFVLAGGTAIMLQIGHRLSYDFDLFCSNDKLLMNLIIGNLKKIFKDDWEIIFENNEVYTIKFQDKIDITFVAYPYRTLKPSVKTESVCLFHLDDLVTNKAHTIGRRNTWRDYVDLFFLMKWEIYSLKQIIKLTQEKYHGEFSEKLFLEQLCFFKDIEITPIVFLKEKYSESEIKGFLKQEVKNYLKRFSK